MVFNTQAEVLKTFTGFQSYGGEQKLQASLNPEAATDRAGGAESVAAIDRNFPLVTASGATDGDKFVGGRSFDHGFALKNARAKPGGVMALNSDFEAESPGADEYQAQG